MTSLRQKFNYRFNRSISNGQGSFIGWIVFFGVVLAAGLTLLNIAINGIEKKARTSHLLSTWGNTINSVLFDGKLPGGDLGHRFVSTLTWMADITFSALVIAFVTNKLRDQIDNLRNGKAIVAEHGHTVILGWSNRIFPLLEQLQIAHSNLRKSTIVVLSGQSRDFMEDEIRSRVGRLKGINLVLRNGDSSNMRDLATLNISEATSIIVLDSNSASDSSVISTVLAVQGAAPKGAPIVVEIDNLTHAAALRQATNNRVLAVQSNQIISRVTAQASRQPGLSAVILDLLDFDGDEIYFQEVPQLVGKSYAEALLSFNKASVIGLRSSSGVTSINPAPIRKIKAGESIIAIAEDDDKVIYTGSQGLKLAKAVGKKVRSTKPEHLLIIGWSQMGVSVLTELTPFLPKGSTVHIVADPQLIDKKILPKGKFNGVSTTFLADNGTIAELAKAGSKRKYDEVIVLAYRENISADDADARTMLTVLLMNKLFDEQGNGVEPTRLVAEILDSRKSELARVANPDDIVVSDSLAALLASQLAENPELLPIFEDLFDADGASVNVRSVDLYATLGKEVSYGEIVSAAIARGESAIGYRTAKFAKGDLSGGVTLNPDKNTRLIPSSGDSVIVVGDL